MTTSVKLTSSGLVKMTGGTETIIIDVDNTYATTSDIVAATSDATLVSTNANDAITSASDATTDADAATSDATSVSTNTDAATSDATSASTIANDAITSASNATTDADAATSNATLASTNAGAATSNATLASTNAAAATSNATFASNLIIAKDFSGAYGRTENIGAVPSETMIIIVRNDGGDMTLNGSATVLLIRGSDDEDNKIHVEEWSFVLFVRSNINPIHFRHMLSVHVNHAPTFY